MTRDNCINSQKSQFHPGLNGLNASALDSFVSYCSVTSSRSTRRSKISFQRTMGPFSSPKARGNSSVSNGAAGKFAFGGPTTRKGTPNILEENIVAGGVFEI